MVDFLRSFRSTVQEFYGLWYTKSQLLIRPDIRLISSVFVCQTLDVFIVSNWSHYPGSGRVRSRLTGCSPHNC